MDEVIPWWRQNFIEEFSALNSNVVVENTEDANFVGGTEQDRKLVKERIQVSKIVYHPRICLAVAMAPFVTLVCCSQPRSSGFCRCTGEQAAAAVLPARTTQSEF
jgi:hypothetical protein